MADHVGGIDKSALGASDLDGLSNSQGSQVFGDIAGGVRLDEEIEIAGLVVTGNRGVRADYFLSRAIGLLNVGTDGNMLANGETEDVSGRWELESVAGSGQYKRGGIATWSMTDMATL